MTFLEEMKGVLESLRDNLEGTDFKALENFMKAEGWARAEKALLSIPPNSETFLGIRGMIASMMRRKRIWESLADLLGEVPCILEEAAERYAEANAR